MDGERLLESQAIGDNVIAILTRLRDQREAVHRIVAKCATLTPTGRQAALEQLIVLGGLRRLEVLVEKEARTMPVYIDINENRVLGPIFRNGERNILRRVLETRFGPLPEWAEARLTEMQNPALEELGERLLDAASLEELFG